MKIAYLGPAGTFTEDALREARGVEGEYEPLRTATIREAILAVEQGEADRALVPFENSIEGSVRSTLDTLAFDAEKVTIVGEHDFAVRAMLIARQDMELERIETVISHPQPLAQCARFLREQLPNAVAPEQREHGGGGQARQRVRRALGGDRRPGGSRALRLHDPARGDRGRGQQRHPLRLDRADGDRAGWWRSLEDIAGLLRAGRRPPRRPGQRAARVLRPRGQPDAGSSRGRCGSDWAATCSSATSTGRSQSQP